MNPNETIRRFDVETDWNRARRKALYQDVVCHFKTCNLDLLSFEDVRRKMNLKQQIYRGVQEIPLARIRGSVGRYDDFTAAFLPRKKHLRERWQQVDIAMQEGKTPPIEVYQVGDDYFVLDGNHRVSIANQTGQDTIEAYVYEFPTASPPPAGSDIDEFLTAGERAEFLQRIGPAAPEAVRALTFTCADRYGELLDMIESYRPGLEAESGQPATIEQAAAAWYEDAYAPAVAKMRASKLLDRFPNRTEADLFLWAWQNNQDLEEMAQEEGFPLPDDFFPASDVAPDGS